MLHAAATLVTSQSDNVAAFVPNLAIPTYTYMPFGGTHSPAGTAPFLIPVMYVGGVPLYPSLPTGDGPQSKGMWQCGALPLMPLWQQPPVGGGGGQEAAKADAKTPGAPTGASTDNITDDVSRKPMQESGDKAPCGASMSAHKDGSGGVGGGAQVRSGTDSDGGPTRAFKQYATKFSGPGGALGASAKQDSDANDRRHSQSTDKDTNQDDSVSLSFESSFFEKSENSESQFSSEKSSEDTDSEMKERRRKQPMRAALREPHWTEGVSLTADLVYRYQLHAPDVEDVLRSDRDKLQRLQQPRLVNEQLSVLQLELEDHDPLDEPGDDELMATGRANKPSSSDAAVVPGSPAAPRLLTADAPNCAMYAMEEDDLTQEMEEKEGRMLLSIDSDF